jgi:hypothetical protein
MVVAHHGAPWWATLDDGGHDVRERPPRTPVRASLAAALAALLLAGLTGACSGSEDASRRPEACGDNDSSEQADSTACREALFAQELGDEPDAAVAELDDERRLELAQQLCARAEDVVGVDGARPLRSQVLADAAAEWKVDPAALDAIAAAAEPLCPERFEQLQSLPLTPGPTAVELSVGGTGPIKVTYTGADGTLTEEDAFAPWVLPLNLADPNEVRVVATPRTVEGMAPEDAATGLDCSISVAGEVVVETDGAGDGPTAECTLSATDLVAAATR